MTYEGKILVGSYSYQIILLYKVYVEKYNLAKCSVVKYIIYNVKLLHFLTFHLEFDILILIEICSLTILRQADLAHDPDAGSLRIFIYFTERR